MVTKANSKITFASLSEIAIDDIMAHMSDPRVIEHMPLSTAKWDAQFCESFVAAKQAYWHRDGLGHWAFLANGIYVGWGGFQKEGDEWDFGLVLKPSSFGLGRQIAQKALKFAAGDDRITYVTFLLPPSRRHLRGLSRLGAELVGEVEFKGRAFLKYKLETPSI